MEIFFFSVAEIEAQEACKWLRAAGFPQYAQMYEGKLNLTFIKYWSVNTLFTIRRKVSVIYFPS